MAFYHATVVQNNQDSRRKYWAFACPIACTALFACSALLASLAHSAALSRSLTCLLAPHLWESAWSNDHFFCVLSSVLDHSARIPRLSKKKEAFLRNVNFFLLLHKFVIRFIMRESTNMKSVLAKCKWLPVTLFLVMNELVATWLALLFPFQFPKMPERLPRTTSSIQGFRILHCKGGGREMITY